MLDRFASHVWPLAEMSPEQELERVMLEIIGALGGADAVLTIHPTEGSAKVLYAANDKVAVIAQELIDLGALEWEQDEPDRHIWVGGKFEPHAPHAIAMPIRRVAGHSRLVITVFFRSLDEEARATAEAAYIARRPFAVGYFRLWQQDRLYRRDIEALRMALDHVGLAVFLVTKAGELAFANTAGRRLLSDGTGLYEARGKMHARNRHDELTLAAALDHVLDRGREIARLPLLIVQRENRAPLTVAIAPLPFPTVEQAEIGAVLLAVDPDLDIKDLAGAVCYAFGLTRTEAELASLLASGKTLQEATTTMRLKSETAKSYLRSVFSKTGVGRQADLIRLILVSLMRTSDERAYELSKAPTGVRAVNGRGRG